MKPRSGAALLLLAPALLSGCLRSTDYGPPPQPPGYPAPGQWVPPPAPAPAPAPAPWWQLPAPQTPFPPLPGWGQLPPLPTPFTPDASQHCLDSINAARATERLPPLARWWPTEACASQQARDGAASGQPHGSFGRCAEMGQNVCPAWAGPADRMIAPCIQSEWSEGPGGDFATHGHYLNLSSTRFTRVACGFYTAPNGQVWAVQDFQ